MARLAAGLTVLGAVVVLAAFDWGFDGGRTPLDVGDGWPTAARCGACHPAEYTDWQTSRHRMAHSNDIYEAGFVAEPKSFCTNCHSPLPEQVAEVRANLEWYQSQSPRNRAPGAVERLPEPLADEGITCAVCHWRDGVVLATTVSGRAPHETREAALRDPAFCASCHQFEMPRVDADGWHTTGELMQATFDEWRAYADAGGRRVCADCHLPDGAHTFRGAHDVDRLRDAVQVRRRGGSLRIVTAGVGHHVPTGDLFRNLTVEASIDGEWAVLHRIGRQFALVGRDDGHAEHRLVEDTALRPGVPLDVALPAGWTAWRVRYHYGSDVDEARGLVPLDALVVTLHDELRAR